MKVERGEERRELEKPQGANLNWFLVGTGKIWPSNKEKIVLENSPQDDKDGELREENGWLQEESTILGGKTHPLFEAGWIEQNWMTRHKGKTRGGGREVRRCEHERKKSNLPGGR